MKEKYSIGLDIGGTKCALCVGEVTDDAVKIVRREEFPTAGKSWHEVLDLYVYNIATTGRGNYPLSTAISMLKSVVSVALLAGANGISKLIRGEGFI